jgi:hypothetical protein
VPIQQQNPPIDPRLLAPYIDHPIEFVEDLIFRYYPISPRPTLNRHEKDLFQAVAESEWISVRSGRGRGKTAGVALLVPWYLATRPMSRVIATAPKIDLLHDVLWSEINKWLQFSPLRELLIWSKEKVENAYFPDTWFAVARTAKTKENVSGYHENYQMMIGEEASGIPDEILETIEQTQVNNVNKKEIKTILISNPTKVTGYFHKTQMLAEWGKYWRRLHFKPTAEEIKNDSGAQRTIAIHGIDHDITRVSVFGEFPSGNPQAILSYSEVWDAMNRTAAEEGDIEIGADIARFGDDSTVLTYRYGYKVFPCKVYKKMDTVQVHDLIIVLVREIRRTHKFSRAIRIKIDDSTMGGGVSDQLLRNRTDGIEVVRCLFGEAGNEHYTNSASVMWAELKSMIGKLELPRDDLLLEELSGRNWNPSLDNRSRQRAESKDDFKKRVHRSPDRADSVVLCCANSQEKAKILPKLIQMRDNVFVDAPVRFDYRNYKRAEFYGSIWHERDMKQSCLSALWDKEDGRLTLFYEGVTRMEGPDEIVAAITSICTMYNRQYHTEIKPRQFTWFGNRAMFGLTDAALEFNNIKDGPYLAWQNKHMIAIQPNFFFDLNGAILQLNKMFEENRIVILKDMGMIKLQLETWVIDNDRPDNEGHSLCLALCNIISMMVQSKRLNRKPKALVPYGVRINANGAIEFGGKKEDFLNRAEKIFAEGHKSRIRYLIPRSIEKRIGVSRPAGEPKGAPPVH